MASSNPLLDDLAGLMTGAMGAARAAGDEAKTAMQARVRDMILSAAAVHVWRTQASAGIVTR